VISTPNLASWRNRLVLLLGWQPFGTEVSTSLRVGNPRASSGPLAGHIRVFTPRALQELVRAYGLAVVQSKGWSSGLPSSRTARMAGWVDRLAEKWFPSLCDGIVLQVRKC
jgi:hypothetical protein